EERGTISFCFSGNIVSNLDGASLRQALLGLFGRKARKKGSKKVTTPMAARPSYAGTPSRPIGTPAPTPVAALGTQTGTPSPVAPVTSGSTGGSVSWMPPPPRSPRASEPMPSGDDPEPGATNDGSELPESPPAKGRGASSPEEAND